MKKRQAQSLLRKYVLPYFPGWHVDGRLMYSWGGRHLLHGVNLSGSALDATSFYVYAFVLPLYKITDHLYYLFGERVGPGWEMHPGEEEEVGGQLVEAIKEEGMTWIQKIDTLETVANASTVLGREANDPHLLEAMAGANVLLGRNAEALAVMDRVAQLMRSDDPNWALTLADRVMMLRRTLEDSPASAVAQLHDWERQTLANLKLPDTRPEADH